MLTCSISQHSFSKIFVLFTWLPQVLVVVLGPRGKFLTSFVWLDFIWEREKRQTSTSEYGVLQPWWSCRNSGEEAERSWENDKWNCGQSFLGPQTLPSALSSQPLRTWVYRLPLGWGLALSEKLHSEDTVFNYIVRQPIDIIWNLQWSPGLKANRICLGEKERRSAGSNYLIPLTSLTLKEWKNLFLSINKTSQKGRTWLSWRDCQTFRD